MPDDHRTRERCTVLIGPRINGNGFWAIVYRNTKVVPLAVASLDDAIQKIAECALCHFHLHPPDAFELARNAVNQYAARIVATEEAHSLAKAAQEQLEEAHRAILALTEELEAARRI